MQSQEKPTTGNIGLDNMIVGAMPQALAALYAGIELGRRGKNTAKKIQAFIKETNPEVFKQPVLDVPGWDAELDTLPALQWLNIPNELLGVGV